MAFMRPRYRRNPSSMVERKGMKVTDDLSGLDCYEADTAIQDGLRKNVRDKGSWDRDEDYGVIVRSGGEGMG